MNEEIYQSAIKELAASGIGAGRLDAPSASARADNALCGDRVILDLQIDDSRVAEFAHETRGCLLCRASAALLAREAPGKSLAELQAAHAALAALLADGAPAEGSAEGKASALPWPDLAIFSPVHQHRSRHSCVLLPFVALKKALAGQG